MVFTREGRAAGSSRARTAVELGPDPHDQHRRCALLDRVSTTKVYAVTEGGGTVTTNNGADWIDLNNGLGDLNALAVVAFGSSSDALRRNRERHFRSADNGAN
jgi:hypothetical protein